MFYRLACLVSPLFCCAAVPALAMPCTSMALVLAIDSSSSVDAVELDLQMQATALALADPEVVSAMQAMGGVAVSVVIWGDSAFGRQVIEWQLVSGAQEAQLFAAGLLDQPRLVGGNTDLGYGINVALDLLDQPDNCATRLVIDVSGDGRETLYSHAHSISLAEARKRAVAMDVVINGLAITADDDELAEYYASHVIAGPGSFVVTVADYTSFADAIKRKFLREIGEPPRPMLASLSDK